MTQQPSGNNINPEIQRATRARKIVMWMWGIFLGIGALIAIMMLLIYNGVIGYMPPIEELEDPHDKLASVVFASDGTTEMGRYFDGAGNRVYTDYKSVSPHLIDALISTEDVRFFEHSGIDFRSLGRSVFKTVLMGDKSSGGGSTITQQLAKQLYSQPSQNLFKRALQKPIEWMIAIKLERFYTKDEIINMYLNRFDFLNNAVGIKTAANVYFGKEPGDLDVAESAMLVGMLKNPAYFNPLRYEERTLNRRNVVIDQMVKAGKLEAGEAELIKSQPLGLNYHKVDHKEGMAPYVREEIRRQMLAKRPSKPTRSNYKDETSWKMAYSQYKTDSTNWEENPIYGWIEKNPKPDGSKYDLYQDGLKIYTTIDPVMQRYAEEAVYEHLGGTLQPEFFAEKRGAKYGPYSQNRTGTQVNLGNIVKRAIKQTPRYRAMKEAGASEEEIRRAFDEKFTMDVFAWVKKDGKIVPGSKTVTMSPRDSLFYIKSILRAGMMSVDPATGYVKAYVGGPDYSSFQYDMVSYGKRQIGSTGKPFLYTLAMEEGETPCSQWLNTQPVYGNWAPRNSSRGAGGMITLMNALTSSNNWISAKLINQFGPASFVNKLRAFGITSYMEPSLPLCLGPYEVPVWEMVGAYTAFPNKGIRVSPTLVARIEDNQGNVLYSATPHRTEVTNMESAYSMVTMLVNVVNHGTGRRVRSYGVNAEIGGKTGTTNDNADGWFMGFTPDLVTGVWVGGDERYIHFNNGSVGQGSHMALPIFGRYMKKLYDDKRLPYSQDKKFDIPADFNPCGGGDWREPDYTYRSSGAVGGGDGGDESEEPEGVFD